MVSRLCTCRVWALMQCHLPHLDLISAVVFFLITKFLISHTIKHHKTQLFLRTQHLLHTNQLRFLIALIQQVQELFLCSICHIFLLFYYNSFIQHTRCRPSCLSITMSAVRLLSSCVKRQLFTVPHSFTRGSTSWVPVYLPSPASTIIQRLQ